MEDIFLFSTSEALEELELFNPLPVTGEDGLFEYALYNCIEEADVKPSLVAQSNLLAGDLLQDFDIEGVYYFLATFLCQSRKCVSVDLGFFL